MTELTVGGGCGSWVQVPGQNLEEGPRERRVLIPHLGKVFASCQEVQDPGMPVKVYLKGLGKYLSLGAFWRTLCSDRCVYVFVFLPESWLPEEVCFVFVSCSTGGL